MPKGYKKDGSYAGRVFKKGNITWNTGLTKDTHPSLKHNSELVRSDEWKRKIGLGNKNKIRTKEMLLAMSKIQKGKISHRKGISMEEEYGKEKANKIKGNITKTLNKRTIQNQYIEEHLNGTMKELERLEKEGFKCISLVKRPIPDIIAIKDEKIYAIEVEYLHKGKNKGCVAYDKYNNITYYDDIKWIFKESEVNKRNENWDD